MFNTVFIFLIQILISGLNTITTKAFETYQVAFETYHTYGMFAHYQRVVSVCQNISMKMAEKYAACVLIILEFL